MKFTLRRVIGIVLTIYCIFSFYIGYLLILRNACETKQLRAAENSLNSVYASDSDDENDSDIEVLPPQREKLYDERESLLSTLKNDKQQESAPSRPLIEIWGKAAIGGYLWEHILDGSLEDEEDGMRISGFQQLRNFNLRYRSGPGFIQTTVPQDIENLVLILNGREDIKVKFAKSWLDYLPRYKKLQNVGVILLGNERCDNIWIEPYLKKNGGLIKALFIVYDSPAVDNQRIYQWPLGVATYRSFPKAELTLADLETPRPFMCNFLGTVYKNSSRETLLQIINSHDLGKYCYLKYRTTWASQESDDSMSNYVNVLAQSDLTLNPIGFNTECYRIYEAMSFGSLPIVEDQMTAGNCGNSSTSKHAPLRLLKQMGAPIIFIKHWSELPALIKNELKLTAKQKALRRKRIFNWYEGFKSIMRDQFLTVLDNHFFHNFS
ncbi:ribitol-5-phosphate xylosyltransferase 1-like [Tubulanus polymorphus]|uniref:ribitol-5-phosphate xylosyltransferase 1-like n=1 Tax=Tubulanus polymorphus TaxID=672921 RepID=UPI003DA3CD6B